MESIVMVALLLGILLLFISVERAERKSDPKRDLGFYAYKDDDA